MEKVSFTSPFDLFSIGSGFGMMSPYEDETLAYFAAHPTMTPAEVAALDLEIKGIKSAGMAVASTEALAQAARVEADSGVIIDPGFLHVVLSTLKAQSILTSAKFIADANIAVKKDGAGAVSTLYDISGNDNDAVQATGSAQPVWTAAQQGIRAGMVFDGDDTLTATPFFAAITNSEIMAVVKEADYGPLRRIVHVSNAAVSRSHIVHTQTTKAYGLYAGSANNQGEKAGLSNNSAYVISSAMPSQASLTVFVNGVAGTEATTDGGAGDAATKMTIGALIGGVQQLVGSLMTLKVFSASLTATQRVAVESMLNTYYAIY